MLKSLRVVLPIMMLLGLSLPLSNLLLHQPPTLSEAALTGKQVSFKKAAPIFAGKCFDCHSSKVQMPFYANFPIAQQTIGHDIEEGLAEFDFEHELFTPNQKPSAVALNKLEYVLKSGEMPPLRYVALHWEAILSEKDKQAIFQWIQDERTAGLGATPVAEAFKSEPVQPLPIFAQGLQPEKIALGKSLYHDTRLSGDGTISCASCHALTTHGGTDGLQYSKGIRGQEGHINAPTVFNATYNLAQFWDGRAADLNAQALGPVANPIEMGADWTTVVKTIGSDPSYRAQFIKAYGPKPITKELIADAIATFEHSLITPNAPFDRYLMGDQTALTPVQKRGYALFKSTGCATCHAGVALGGQSYETLGRHGDYFADRQTQKNIALHETDGGRFNVTQQKADTHKFKVPTLRNIAKTAPYFHDGSVATLDEAVDLMARYQLNVTLSAKDRADLVAFLESLTGEYDGKPVN